MDQLKFYDSYGTPVKPGSRILVIQRRGIQECLDHLFATVRWNEKRGRFELTFEYSQFANLGPLGFEVLEKFKVVE